MKKKVFISYSSNNYIEAEAIKKLLEEEGISYFKAPEMIPAGSNYAREIPKAIAACTIFLILISKDSQNSMWVEKELDCAMNQKKKIVPVMLDQMPLNDVFRFYLNNVQMMAYVEPKNETGYALMARIGALLNEDKSFKEESGLSDEEKIIKEETRRLNAVSTNQIPVECNSCGSGLRLKYRGSYECVSCGRMHYDSYQTIRNYLNGNGPKTMVQIAAATGIPRKTIEYFLRDERLEIPMDSAAFLRCEKCGANIRTGVLCDRCKDLPFSSPIKSAPSSGYSITKGRLNR